MVAFLKINKKRNKRQKMAKKCTKKPQKFILKNLFLKVLHKNSDKLIKNSRISPNIDEILHINSKKSIESSQIIIKRPKKYC